MKLRIKGNSLRLRLAQQEVLQLKEKGIVQETIKFGIGEPNQLKYIIRKSVDQEIKAYFNQNRMLVEIPDAMAMEWATTAQVGLEHTMSINEEEDLYILIEKDFKCLQPRPNEDESDLFTNPSKESHNC